MTLSELRNTIGSRDLTVKELFSGTMRIMERNFERCLLVAAMVYIPLNLISEYILTGYPDELTLKQYLTVCIVQLVISIVGMMATCVAAVITEEQLKADETPAFWDMFSAGIGGFPRFIVTLLMGGLVFGAAIMVVLYIGLTSDLMLPLAMILVLVLALLLVVFMYQICAAAVLRKYCFHNCIRYVILLTKPRAHKTLGMILLLSLAATLVKLPITYLLDSLLSALYNRAVYIIINSVVGGILSVANLFADIGIVLYFLNGEMGWFRRQREQQLQGRQEPPSYY